MESTEMETAGNLTVTYRLVHQVSGKLLTVQVGEDAGHYEVYENKFLIPEHMFSDSKVNTVLLELYVRNRIADSLREMPQYDDAAPVPWVKLISVHYQLTGEPEWHEVSERLTDRQLAMLYQRRLNRQRWAKQETSFGWVIRRVYTDCGEKQFQYLSGFEWDDQVISGFQWLNSPHNTELFSTDFKDAVMAKLKLLNADAEYEAVELFTAPI